jgi:hypothetical protein
MHPGDEDLLPDLASACHRAVTTLMRRYDLVQYSAMVSNIGHGYLLGARATTEPSKHRSKRGKTNVLGKTK